MASQSPDQTVADRMIGLLVDEWDVHHVFGIPGDGINPIVEALRRDRNQLWAEAVHRYRDGEAWWFDHDEQVIADEVTEHHRAEHAWADPIRTWWSNLAANKRAKYEAEGFALADVAVGALQLTTDQLDHKERAIGRALRDSGFELTKTGRERVRRWFKKRAL